MGKIIKKVDFKPPFIRPEISLEECRKILCKYGAKYTDKEIEEIRILMANIAEIDYLNFKKKQRSRAEEAKIIKLKTDDDSQNEIEKTG